MSLNRFFSRVIIYTAILLVGMSPMAFGQEKPEFTFEKVWSKATPYQGQSNPDVDISTMTGKILCGYQGWFTCPGDGSDRGWFHWGKTAKLKGDKNLIFEPGTCKIDMWPDLSEYDKDELYPTPFKHADGSTAYVYSSMNGKSVRRHFKWMRDYGIDGVYVQRFATETYVPVKLNHYNTVLNSCRAGANEYGRAYAIMYDLSGLPAGGVDQAIKDWKNLVDHMKLTRDPNDKAYLHHKGKPVVAVWGIGFNDNRKYTLDECAKFVDFLKNDKKYGGCTVVVGVPAYWRTMKPNTDSVNDKRLHEIILSADVVCPWTIARFKNSSEAASFAKEVIEPDIKWCEKNGKEYLPVVWPGFSWHNMYPEGKFDQIPRRKGKFLWKQYYGAINSGSKMIYQAMFDEVDEATAIF